MLIVLKREKNKGDEELLQREELVTGSIAGRKRNRSRRWE